MGDLKKLAITIEEINQKDNRFSIKAGGLKYSFFKTKQDGNESKAYQQYKEFGLENGSTIGIAYDETQGDFNGKTVTYRNIKFFDKQIDLMPQQLKENLPPQKEYNEEGPSQGNAKNIAGLWVAHKIIDIKDFEKEANRIYNFTPTKPEEPKIVPNEEVTPEINTDDIPF